MCEEDKARVEENAMARRQRREKGNSPRAHHRLSPLPVPKQRLALDQVLDNLLLARGQPEVGEAVLVGDGLVVDATEGEDEAYDDSGSFCWGRRG